MFLIWSLVLLVCLVQAQDVDKKIEDAESESAEQTLDQDSC